MNQIKQTFIPGNTPARPGYTMVPKYVTIHNTANSSQGAGAASHSKYMTSLNGYSKQVSYHLVVDDKETYQLLPYNEVAWHAGDGGNGTGNRNSIAIEICENPESDLTKATDNAAELTAYLMHLYNIPLQNVVQHNHWSGKDCPHLIRDGKPYTWDEFLNKVNSSYAQNSMDGKPAEDQTNTDQSQNSKYTYRVQIGAFRDRSNAVDLKDLAKEKGYDDAWILFDGLFYRVQLGAFAVKQNADNFASELKLKGFQTYVYRVKA